ncbi:MAG: hypothetical protein ACFFDF_18965 [Candidatus Odinarchaeota archaeon]
MIFQDFVGSIIGSIITTIGAVAVWVIIDFIKKYQERKKLRKNIGLLYHLFAKGISESHLAIKIKKIIDEIGKNDMLNILKFTVDADNSTRLLFSKEFIIHILFGRGRNDISISCNELTYHFEFPNKNQNVLEKFLEFYREQCKNENVKLKLKSL